MLSVAAPGVPGAATEKETPGRHPEASLWVPPPNPHQRNAPWRVPRFLPPGAELANMAFGWDQVAALAGAQWDAGIELARQALAPAAVAGSLTTTFTLVTPHEDLPNAERAMGLVKIPLPIGGPPIAKLPAHICQMRSHCK